MTSFFFSFFERINGILSPAALSMLSSGWQGCVSGDCFLLSFQDAWHIGILACDDGSWDFSSHKLRWAKIFSPQPLTTIEVLQKHPLFEHCVLPTRGVKLGRTDPWAVLFVVGYFIRERKATLSVCKPEESLIKLIFCYLKYAYTCFCGALRGSCSQKARADGGRREESHIAIVFFIQACEYWACMFGFKCMHGGKKKGI